MKTWIQRSIISGILIMLGESAVTVVEVWGTPQFPTVAAAKIGAILIFIGEIIRRQKADPVESVKPPEDPNGGSNGQA